MPLTRAWRCDVCDYEPVLSYWWALTGGLLLALAIILLHDCGVIP